MIKVAILSYWHVHAKDYANDALKHPDTEIIAVWDELPERGKQKAEQLGVPFYASLTELLALPELDGVIVVTPTNMHRDVMVAAAQAGKHIFTEKVLATTMVECNEIMREVDKAGVKLTVSLPRLNSGSTQTIKQLLDQKQLGTLTQVRVRLSHNGAIADWLPEHFYSLEQCGGGALIDLGCHPMYLTRLFLGMPDSVSTSYGYVTNREVEDNAVSILNYKNGAIGIVEAGFVNSSMPFCIEVHGTEGSILYGTPENKILVSSRSQDNTSTEWQEHPLAVEQPSAFEQWVSHIQNDTVASDNIELALDLSKLMEASNLSAKQQKTVQLGD